MAVLGIITPPMIILSVVTFFYQAFRDNVWVARALSGVRAVVAPVVLSAVLKLQKTGSALPRVLFYTLCATGCILSFVFQISSVMIVLAGVGFGLLYHFKHKEPAP